MREKKISGFLFPASANVEAWDEFALRFYSRDDPHNESPPAETESTAPRSALRERTGILLSTPDCSNPWKEGLSDHPIPLQSTSLLRINRSIWLAG